MQNARSLLDQLLGQVDLSSISGSSSASAGSSGSQEEPGVTSQFGQIGGVNLDSLLSGKGGLATGAVAGGLVGLLMGGKKPKKIAKSALKLGGAALVGGLAYKAWKDYKSGAPAGGGFASGAPTSRTGGQPDRPEPLPIEDASNTPFMPDGQAEQEALSQSLIAAMIGAAKADGHITDEEKQRISSALQQLDITGDHRQFIEAELQKPLDVGAIAATAKSEEHRVELYAASLIAVDPEGAAEKGYLAMLAARLGLDPELVKHLHANADRLLAN